MQRLAAAPPSAAPLEIPDALRAFSAKSPQASVWLTAPGQAPVLLAQGTATVKAHAPGPIDLTPGVGPLRFDSGQMAYSTTVAVARADGNPGTSVLTFQRTLGGTTQATTLIERLIGSDAQLKFGNASGDLWTDLAKPVPGPPASTPGTATTYKSPSGEIRLGTARAIPNTPWLLWVDVPEASVLGPATALLQRMIPITLALTILGALAVYTLSGRIVRPLAQLADAADAITAGDYSRRVTVGGGSEVRRLSVAFNHMAAQVAESHSALEARVQARTQELDLAREELDRFFSLSLDLLCIAGVDGSFKRVNPAWQNVLGWTVDDLTTVPYMTLVHPDDRENTAAEAAKLAEGTSSVNFENRYRTKDGSYRWLNWTAVPLPGRGVVYAVAHDVTELKRTEVALHQYGAELATANRELESFSYSVSHDLRAPLRSIDGFAQALTEDYENKLDATGKNYLSRIRAAAQRMGTLIDDLLSLSRVTRGELTRTSVNLSALAEETVQRLREQDPARSIEWRIQPDVVVEGDPRWLRVALDNLLGNAWKFTSKKDGAVIEFAAVPDAQGAPTFVVRDNGAGFDMAYAGKLFGAFQRLHGANEFPGTGIGLATVHRIVRRHGGRIWAEGARDSGAAFFFTLEAA